MTASLTPWFTPGTKPAHVGVYQTVGQPRGYVMYQHWDGYMWGYAESTLEGAVAFATNRSVFQGEFWRGLSEKPK